MTNAKNKKKQISDAIKKPPICGEYANWAGVNQSELQTIIDFGFVQPDKTGEPKSGIIIKRIILPPKVAKELGNILLGKINNEKSKKKTT